MDGDGAGGAAVQAVPAVEAALAVVGRREAVVHAFAFLDPERARAEARAAVRGPLSGLTLGVKDVFDTADQPSEYGSPIYAGHRPVADAAVVALLRGAGAVVLGKTVTAELAWVSPGPTTNPQRPTHTPGGSSSGSAAAVAAGMVDLALGTQTAGSVIRPASFCGVLGLKPTFGLLPTAGVKQAAPSLDTVGLFARDFEVLERAVSALHCHRPSSDLRRARFALCRTELWAGADPDCQAAIERAAGLVDAAERQLPSELVGLTDEQVTIQSFEGARALAWERRARAELLSADLRSILDAGEEIDPAAYATARRRAATAATPTSLEAAFGDADVLLTPASVGEAPEGLDSTGAPRFNRLWTLLGCPALSVPGLSGATGLPIGVQLVARPYAEAVLLRAGRLLAGAMA